jgi:hypothetical protein
MTCLTESRSCFKLFHSIMMSIPDLLSPISLVEVFRFVEMSQNIDLPIADLKIKLFASARGNPQQEAVASFLMACHLIMSGSLGFEEAYLALQPPERQICRRFAAFKDSLRAISCARCLNWIDFGTQESGDLLKNGCIEMHEYMHYSRYYMHCLFERPFLSEPLHDKLHKRTKRDGTT